jgi:chromosome segregation ATPase
VTDLTTSQAVVDIIVAVVVAVLAYGATSLIALRRDERAGRNDDVNLFNQVKRAAAEQMLEMRNDLIELRARVDTSEERADEAERRADKAFRQLRNLRTKFNTAVDHMGRLEETLRAQGMTVPIRPTTLRDLSPDED